MLVLGGSPLPFHALAWCVLSRRATARGWRGSHGRHPCTFVEYAQLASFTSFGSVLTSSGGIFRSRTSQIITSFEGTCSLRSVGAAGCDRAATSCEERLTLPQGEG